MICQIKFQIAIAEKSARARRKEQREKHRKDMSGHLGIDAWKCDQVKFDIFSSKVNTESHHTLEFQILIITNL